MKKIFFLVLFSATLFFLGIRGYQLYFKDLLPPTTQEREVPLSDYRIAPATIGTRKYELYVAESDKQRSQGLSYVPVLNSNQGMVFVFPSTDRHSFWMKGMHFNLDFVFVDGSVVADLQENISPDTFPAMITPQKAANMVIELNAGEIQKSGIQRGDSIKVNL